jgi:hypothetical protein
MYFPTECIRPLCFFSILLYVYLSLLFFSLICWLVLLMRMCRPTFRLNGGFGPGFRLTECILPLLPLILLYVYLSLLALGNSLGDLLLGESLKGLLLGELLCELVARQVVGGGVAPYIACRVAPCWECYYC